MAFTARRPTKRPTLRSAVFGGKLPVDRIGSLRPGPVV